MGCHWPLASPAVMAIDQLSPQYQNTAVGTETRNRVLRNTYGLLALSMIPTVIGAWIGVATRFTFFAGSPAINFIAFLAIAWGFMFGISRYHNNSVGILLLLGFTFFMGLPYFDGTWIITGFILL